MAKDVKVDKLYSKWHIKIMQLPKGLTTVIPVSKLLATILFVSLPVVGFILGMRHQQTVSSPSVINYPTPTISSNCYYVDNPEAACPKKDCGKILICPTPAAEKCAEYTNLGKTTTACATCGNNICEPYETCTPSVIGIDASTADCGPLECSQDCKK